jgi:hypothetical protein
MEGELSSSGLMTGEDKEREKVEQDRENERINRERRDYLTTARGFGAFQSTDTEDIDGHKMGYDYLKFLLNPDCCEPVRMPARFTYPSVIMSYADNFQFTLSNGGASNGPGDFVGFFNPQQWTSGQQAVITNLPPSTGTCMLNLYSRGSSSGNNSTFTTAYLNQSWTFMQRASAASWLAVGPNVVGTNPVAYTAPNSSVFHPYASSFNGARLIAAVLEISYVGPLQDQAGVILVSADVLPISGSIPILNNGVVSPVNTQSIVPFQSPPSQTQMANCRLFKKFDGSETARILWYPVDRSCEEFVNISSTGASLQAGYSATQSMLFFNIMGLGFTSGSTFDIRYKLVWEAIPNKANYQLFNGSMGMSFNSNWKESWAVLQRELSSNPRQILVTGVKK